MGNPTRQLLLVFSAFNLIVLSTDAGEAEISRVQVELPVAARHLEEMFAQVQGTARLWREKPHARRDPILSEARFAVDHGMEKVELSRFTSDARQTKLGEAVYCVGKGTAFELQRRGGSEDYIIKGIGTTEQERNRYLAVFGRILLAHRGVAGLPMSRFLDLPSLQITAAETYREAGETLMKVDCVVNVSGEAETRISLVLDPEGGWVVRSCRYHPSKNPKQLTSVEIDYGPAHAGIRLPRRVKLTALGNVTHHCEFTDWAFVPTPISDFRMSHYGLPDMMLPRRRPHSVLYWLVGLAVLIGFAAFLLRWIASRRSQPA